ncbi:AbrB/MazE/SpoVT family DNA-binding domain-containing protein [bacterium]|nr:AbrB/MazE/SpoVT family DNA-binding domain-containing protein [bacterium]
MLIEIRKKNQITLPSEMMRQMSLKEGDVLSIETSHQQMILRPVVVVPKENLPKLYENIDAYLASEDVLKKDWMNQEEEEAWKHL